MAEFSAFPFLAALIAQERQSTVVKKQLAWLSSIPAPCEHLKHRLLYSSRRPVALPLRTHQGG